MANKSSAFFGRLLRHFGVITGLLLWASFAYAQTSVIISPVPQLQFFDQSGRPLSFGCVFTYQNQSVTPLATYTDWTGTTQNANPVILTAGGSANIWVQAGVAYTFKVASSGGINCASGSTLYTVNGIGGGSSTLTTVVPYSATPSFVDSAQNQLFKITLTGNASSQPLTAVGIVPPGLVTWEIVQDGVGGHTFSWPANMIGGCTIGSAANQPTLQQFIWDGNFAIATGPCVTGSGPIVSTGNLYDFGLAPNSAIFTDANHQLTTTPPGGAGTVTYNGQAVALGTSGNVNPGAAAHSIALNEGNGTAITGVTLSNDQVALGSTGADPTAASLPSSCSDANGQHLNYSGGAFSCGTSSAGKGVVQASTITTLGADVPVSGTTSILTKSVTMPSTGCPCRAFVSYGFAVTNTTHGVVQTWVSDSVNSMATTQVDMFDDANPAGGSASSFSPVTYSNGSNVTFTFTANNSSGSGIVIQKVNAGSVGQNTWLNVAIFTSQ